MNAPELELARELADVRQRLELLERLEDERRFAPAWDRLQFGTAVDVAQRLCLSVETVRSLMRRKHIPSVKIGMARRIPLWWLAGLAAVPQARLEALVLRGQRAARRASAVRARAGFAAEVQAAAARARTGT